MKIDIDLSIPLKLTRTSLYVLFIFLSIVFILFPWSVLAYIKFYSTLIPTPAIELPVHLDYGLTKPYARIENKLLRQLNQDSDYEFTLKLNAYCLNRDYDSIPVSQVLSLIKVEQSGLSASSSNIVHSSSIENRTPVLNGAQEYSKIIDQRTLTRSAFVLHCDPQINYIKSNSIIPYDLRSYIPPFIQSGKKFNKVDIALGSYTRESLWTENNYDLLIEFNKAIAIEGNAALEISIRWEGIRYYLFHYRIACFAIGVLAFWFISSFVCLIVSISIWYLYSSSTSDNYEFTATFDDTLQGIHNIKEHDDNLATGASYDTINNQ